MDAYFICDILTIILFGLIIFNVIVVITRKIKSLENRMEVLEGEKKIGEK